MRRKRDKKKKKEKTTNKKIDRNKPTIIHILTLHALLEVQSYTHINMKKHTDTHT
jgi:hypothetical protein